jgi:hypothetical protein
MIVSQESTEVRWTPRHEISGLQIHPTTSLRLQHFFENRSTPYVA